ncbi:MAG: hypothetical protein AAF623_06730 [Planctomycetota bacterium]
MTTSAEIRRHFREFVGEQKYQKFVVTCQSSGNRLRYWQEDAWREFTSSHPEFATSNEQVLKTFLACPEFGKATRQKTRDQMITDWLIGPELTIDEIESRHMVHDDRLGDLPVSFGFQHDQWEKLKSKMNDSDTIREFKSPPESWANRAGRQGYAVLRNETIIGTIVTLMN